MIGKVAVKDEKIGKVLEIIASGLSEAADKVALEDIKTQLDRGELTVGELQEMEWVAESVLGITDL